MKLINHLVEHAIIRMIKILIFIAYIATLALILILCEGCSLNKVVRNEMQTITVRANNTKRVTIDLHGEMITEQGHTGININDIMERYDKGGLIPPPAHGTPQYGDFTQVDDYHSALIAVQNAEQLFDAMPGKVKQRFNNDPGEMLEFLSDEGNRREALELGLIDDRQAVDMATPLNESVLTNRQDAPEGTQEPVPEPN